jgi:hypothetical protein
VKNTRRRYTLISRAGSKYRPAKKSCLRPPGRVRAAHNTCLLPEVQTGHKVTRPHLFTQGFLAKKERVSYTFDAPQQLFVAPHKNVLYWNYIHS